MPIVDPSLKDFGRLWIPLEQFECTKALRRFLGGAQIQPSLCMLHQKGHCNGGPKCNQAHVQLPFMRRIRQALQARPFNNCCVAHGDLASQRSDFQAMARQRPLRLKLGNVLIALAPTVLAMTEYFDCYIQEMARQPHLARPILLDSSRICNLHQRQECKYGPDCRNIHLCRDFWASLPAPLTMTGSMPVVPASELAATPAMFLPCGPLPASLMAASATPSSAVPTIVTHPLIVPVPQLAVPVPAALPVPTSTALGPAAALPPAAPAVPPSAAPAAEAAAAKAGQLPRRRQPAGPSPPSVPSAGPHRTLRGGQAGRPRNAALASLPRPTAAPLPLPPPSDTSGSDSAVHDGEPATPPNALTSEDASSADEAEAPLPVGRAESARATPLNATLFSEASVRDQRAIFQSLSSDLLGDASLGVDLPWTLINELKEMLAP
eukprot:EG_transcript_6114